METTPSASARPRPRLPWIVVLCGFLAVAGFYLWTEHRAHLLGALPYLLFLLCPLLHVLGHRGHGRHEGGGARGCHGGGDEQHEDHGHDLEEGGKAP